MSVDSPLITEHDLRLLSIGFFVQAGIAAFYTIMLLAYAGFASVILAGIAQPANDSGQNLPPGFLPFMSIFMLILALIAGAYTVALFVAGLWLRRFRNILFIQVVAAFNCVAIPYGTVLSIFTFLVLQRPSAKQMFAGPSLPSSPPVESPSA